MLSDEHLVDLPLTFILYINLKRKNKHQSELIWNVQQVLLDSSFLLRPLQHLLKVLRVNAQYNICIHLDEASIAIKGKSRISTLLSQSLAKGFETKK